MSEQRHIKKARGASSELRILPHRSYSDSEDGPELIHGSAKSSNTLDQIGIVELLEHDIRPTFIIDLGAAGDREQTQMRVVFSNKSLRFFDGLRNVVFAETFYPSVGSSKPELTTAEAEFQEWAISEAEDSSDSYLPRHSFYGVFWTCSTLRDRWRVVSASQVPSQRRQGHGTPKSSSSRSTPLSTSSGFSYAGSVSSDNESISMDDSIFSKQLVDSESKFKVLTELNPVGMYYLSPDGNIVYANDRYEITGHPRGLEGEMSFMNVISESDHPKISDEWILLTTERGKRTFELRLRNPSYDEWGKPRQRWILASCDQVFDKDGSLKSIIGCITDISLQKQVEIDAVEKAVLAEKLALRTQQAAEYEKHFRLMAELAPCGMFTSDSEGTITWANSRWYEMTGHPRNPIDHCPMSFLSCIEPQGHDPFRDQWKKLTVSKEEVSTSLRLKKPWKTEAEDQDVRETTWILFLALPQLDDSGNLNQVLGCTTDISGFKWAESVQIKSRLQAEEAKRQQETFIDMTSHEMRNPLSALLMCADGIVDSLLEFESRPEKTAAMSEELVKSNLDAAQTIVLCAQHQKRIIDDVLTLSKLNSAMLHVTPMQVQVEGTVRRTLKMFESELIAHDIHMSFVVEESYREANIDMVFCDPVRLTQIFINLLTNAIKFTRREKVREISVKLGASSSKPPPDADPDIEWFPSKDSRSIQDLTLSPEWGNGQPVFLYFVVRDTGKGLSTEEKTRLFHRFSQASPRTHVQYGGSGLGLYISRELTELQGGEIGVSSVGGPGSTFAFYIKGRRSPASLADNPNNLTRPSFPSSRVHSATDVAVGLSLPVLPVSSLSPRPSTTRNEYHILLVEDNHINQKVLSKQLRSNGCTVYVANHGGEALEFLTKTNLWNGISDADIDDQGIELSLILMDLEMPVMDGLICTRKIRDLEQQGKLKRHVPIIAVTANTRMEQRHLALESGVNDIVPKPFQMSELMIIVNALMAKSR